MAASLDATAPWIIAVLAVACGTPDGGGDTTGTDGTTSMTSIGQCG